MKTKRKVNFKMNLQTHAAGDNNNLTARSYQLEFRELLTAVFQKRAYHADFFGGGIEVLDGVSDNATAFVVKTSDIPVVVGNYNKGANIGMGTGTGKTTRFGDRKEIIYTNTSVPYDWDWAIHEGIDRHTVNNDFEATIADRLDLHAQAKVNLFNSKQSLFISTNAGKTVNLPRAAGEEYADAEVIALFNELATYFVNIEAVGEKVAKVKPELYNVLIAHPLTTSAKNSSTNIDRNEVPMFKGFEIEQLPDAQFQAGEVAYAYIKGVGKAFTGINTARTFESEDFDGVALQGAGKAGEYILPDNKKAVVKVKETVKA